MKNVRSHANAEALRYVAIELHDVAFMLNHPWFGDSPEYYTERAEWEKADALNVIERGGCPKTAITAMIAGIVGTDAWNALRDRRTNG